MNIVIVNGSPRKNGATGKILKEAANYLSEKTGCCVELRNLSDYKMAFCKGCMLCYKTGNCIITNDGISSLTEELKTCDAVIFGTPTYGSNVSGQFKTFIDRAGFVFGQLLYGKYGFAVSTYENAAGREAIKILKKLFLYSGAACTETLLVKLDHNTDPFKDDLNLKTLHRKIDRFYKNTKLKQKPSVFERIMHKLVINVGLKPRVFRYKDRYAGIIQRWKEINII